jgi:hypothetical protein
MLIANQMHRVVLKRDIPWLESVYTWMGENLNAHEYPLRFAIVAVEDNEIVIEVTTVTYAPDLPYAKALSSIEILKPRRKVFQASPNGGSLRVWWICRGCWSGDQSAGGQRRFPRNPSQCRECL